MTTIPASQLVNVIPNVLNAGGNALVMNGLVLTQNTRVPIGQVLSFPNDGVSVSNFFGPSSEEAEIAAVYFNGFNNSTQKPATILFAQYASASVAAYLQGGKADQLSLAQLQALSGTLSVNVDGYVRTANAIDLSSANSFSAAAALIQTDLNSAPPQAAAVTGAIAPATAAVTASIAGNVMYVTGVTSGVLVAGAALSGAGVSAGTQITDQLSGTPGGIGEYAVSIEQVVASTAVSATYGTLTVTALASGTLAVGQTLAGAGVTAGTRIVQLGSGEGLTGTYFVDKTQTVASGAITASATPLDVSYDSVSGGFVITSAIAGAASSAAFATGSVAAGLFLTQATGATLSQGADGTTPAAFMAGITQLTQNWATFMTIFDPDGGSGSVQKQAFAEWVNNTNKRYAYIAWDTDITPTEGNDATSSFGNIIASANLDGTCAIYHPAGGITTPAQIAAFICGAAASIDFQQTNGRITFAFRGQDGLVAGVTTATVASNLIANGYNFYGAYATAAQQFLEFQNGTVSGEFEWLDSYINQIWLNNQLQLSLMELIQNINSVPYNAAGYELIKAACLDPINQALNFGAIRAGVTLSALQIAQINSAAGVKASDTLELQGWYLQVKDATPQVRQARQSPPINFRYMDGESVQQIELTSTLVQ
ncbi:DUF3383 domain-containing protein [Mesorhizobium sp. M1A.F.Ca.IN.020.03.2.1]|uniref:DUF3383 family protein n=1 Tax=Mesorhizobium sp. M1A.F.Ca.IN.020.03.2.1 TaxID=2496769 RepID=UPI000FD26E6F|nr:DUF3383 family protein [Mesorhizobium sp. M1A.F.Ca.IN.020.03.2.1]RUV07761.1 DUF3383 domain-containing protein [Mesorhizobium sp. M1A.F.Ca.IN.020.03.2.1]